MLELEAWFEHERPAGCCLQRLSEAGDGFEFRHPLVGDSPWGPFEPRLIVPLVRLAPSSPTGKVQALRYPDPGCRCVLVFFLWDNARGKYGDAVHVAPGGRARTRLTVEY
jgi:hypothetical protein